MYRISVKPISVRYHCWKALYHDWKRPSIRLSAVGAEIRWERTHAQSTKYVLYRPTQFQHRYYNTERKMDVDPVKAIGYQIPDWSFSYTANDVILYALGVGVSTAQTDYLKLLFERSTGFYVLPSYGLIPAQQEVLSSILQGRIPGFEKIDPAKVLHAEQYLEVYNGMPTANTLRNKAVVLDVMDKRSGALLLIDVHTYDNGNNLVAYNQFSIFVVGAGGFGGKKDSDHVKPTIRPPVKPADFSITQATSIDQAALYRLSGDDNSLHINPETAARAGFSRPILHGMCTLGFAIRHILDKYANNDVAKFKAVKVRFSKPVFPGQTIETATWREGNRVYFQCKVAETNDVVISGAYVDFHTIE